jgi:hypothetical protein
VTSIDLGGNQISAEDASSITALVDRNTRLRHLFLFDARQMLLSLMCADECGVVWPYLLDGDDVDLMKASSCKDEALIRAEFAVVVEERRCRARLCCADSCS